MSTKSSKTLKASQSPQTENSVFDFLYYDAQRVAVFMSQFNSYGHLTQLTKSREASERSKTSDSTEGSASALAIAKIKGTYGTESESSDKFNDQKTYDPGWNNLLTFLDTLSERDMLKRDIAEAGIGQFVLATGELEVSDLQIVEKAWKLKTFEKLLRAGSKGKAGNDEAALIMEFLTILPHSVQAKLRGDHEIWSSIAHRWLSVATSDLLLAHGKKIPGKWNMVGILDARPDPFDFASTLEPDFNDPTEGASKFLTVIAPIARTVLGRPPMSFAITPLAIFREIKV